MSIHEQKCAVVMIPDCFGGANIRRCDNGSMGKEDRKMRVLGVLVDSGCAMPPTVIFRNAKLRGADFERRAVDNYLEELYEEGYVRKLDVKALDQGEIEDIPLAEQGYFVATGAGERKYNNS